MGLLIDPIPDSPNQHMRIIWQTERRITNEVLGVRGLTVQTHSGIELIYGKKKKKSKMLPMVTSSMCLSLNRA